MSIFYETDDDVAFLNAPRGMSPFPLPSLFLCREEDSLFLNESTGIIERIAKRFTVFGRIAKRTAIRRLASFGQTA